MVEQERETFEGYCILELMGHRRLGGYVKEATIGGGSFLRIDVPGKEVGSVVATQFYSPSAVYCITPTTELMARTVAIQNQPELVSEWELKRAGLLETPKPPESTKTSYEFCACCGDRLQMGEAGPLCRECEEEDF